jgi:4-amino-4-deoxy-L-arabinose transferase-like glycosyltransferase
MILETLRRRPALLVAILGCYFLFEVVVRLSIRGAMGLDEAEQIFLSQWFAPGYNSQPPFYNWLQYGVISVLGVSIFSLALLKNAMLFASYVLYWLAARLVIRDRSLAAIAMLGLLTIPQIAFEAQRDLTHTVATIFAASFFLYALFRTLKHPSGFSYALTGVAIGIGLISKYNFALLPAAALLAILTDKEFRARLFDWRLVLTAVLALIVITPHLLWLTDNLDLATERTRDKMGGGDSGSLVAQIGWGLASLVESIAGFSAVTLAVFALAFRETVPSARRSTGQMIRVTERMMAIGLGFIVLLILFAGTENVMDRWLTPLLTVLPIYLCLRLDGAGAGIGKGFGRMLTICAAIMVIVPAILFARVTTVGWTGNYQWQNQPFKGLVQTINTELGQQPAVVVTVDPYTAGNMRLQLPAVPVIAVSHANFTLPFRWSQDHPILFVWQQRNAPPPPFPKALQEWLDNNGGNGRVPEMRIVHLPYVYGAVGDQRAMAYGWIYPQ